AFKPQEDRTEYKIIRGVVDSLKKKASQETDNRNFDVDKVALTKAIAAVKDAETLIFDVDLTIALHRAGQMESSIAEILYKVMTQKNGPKKLRIVTGRSFEELNNTEFFAPLLGLFRKTNATYDIEVYVSEGADKYLVNNGELEKVSGYSKPFTKVEADIIMQVLEESHRKIDREQELSKRGIDKRIINESNVKFSYSPYGKESSEYDFESDDNEKSKISKKFPERKTRDKLISELVEEIKRRGIKDIAGRKGGVSTIGFVREDVCKKEAVRHILESQKGAKAVYFGDEFGNLLGQLPGNDSVVVDPDIVDSYPEFHVVALNDRKEGVYMPKLSRDAMFWVGGFYRGTQEVLKGAYDIILAEDPDEIAAVADVKDMLSRLYGIEESSIERIYRFEKGKGTHEKFFKIDTKDKKSYKLVYSNKELFADTLPAARYEVWLINTLGAANPRIPVVPIVEKKRLWIDRDKKWETDSETDGYISKGRDGKYYILYEYMDGDGIAPAPADISGDDPRFRALVENGARMHTVLLGIKKDREAKGLKPYPYSRIYARSGSGIRGPEGDNIIDVADFSAGLDAVCASANKKAPASNPKLAQTKHFILEHSEFIKEQIAVMKKNLRDLYPKLRRLPIHGDWAPHNFLFKNGEVVGMLDWEHSREEAMVFDLVGAIRAGEVNADGRDTGRFNLQDMRTLITTYVEAFNRLNPEDRLRKEEIEALPEIFRCRILYRLSRIANPDRYYEARGFKFSTGTKDEEKAAILMASDDELFKWHVELVTALFNLDEMIRSGNIYGKVVEPLINTVPDSIAGTAPIKKTVRKPSAILEECLEQVRSDPKHFSIPFKPLSDISLARLMAKPKSVFELVKAKKYRWAKDGYMYSNGWVKLEASDKVFYERENVVIYQKLDDILYVALRGYGDRALKANIGRDQARIKIAVDSRGNIKSITRDNVGEYDLSRSGMALELKDSGVFNDFPELEKALKYQLVWQDIKTDLRVRELRDASVVNLALVK
ncbi:MAG: phosphotransferase, partial [Candidatus Omnitrophota bacterium]